jgi:hypothetical protein
MDREYHGQVISILEPTIKIQQVALFMRLLLKSSLVASLAIASAVPALAAETRVVPANQASAIFFYYTVSSDTCYSGAKPRVHFTRDPDHGSVTSAWKGFRMPKQTGKCAGKPMHGTLVVYRPAPGYHGPDKVSVVFSEAEGNDYFVRPREYTVNITVK